MRNRWKMLMFAAGVWAASVPAGSRADATEGAADSAAADGPVLASQRSDGASDERANVHASENRATLAASRPETVPATPLSPQSRPARVRPASAGPHDEFLGALWRLQERIDQLEHENRRLASDLVQLQTTPAFRGRSSRFFQVSPLRDVGLDGLGAAPVHYETELAALEQALDPHAAGLEPGTFLPPDAAAYAAGGCECGQCMSCGYGTGEGGRGFGCEGVFEFSIDWLNWKANRDGLDFVITGDNLNNAIGPGNLKLARTGRDNGIRLGLFRRETSGWDFGIRYTEFDAQGRNSVVDPDGVGNMTATRIHPVGAPLGEGDITAAKTDYELQYDLIDIEAGRAFSVGTTGAVRPFAAIRSARIDQDLNTLYSSTTDFDDADVVAVIEVANMSSVGMLIGSEAHWHLRERCLVFGRAAAGLHVGTFDISNVQVQPNTGDVIVQVKEDHRDVVMSFEMAGGVGCRVWDRRPAAVDVQVGYEIQHWDNLADFIRFVDDANAGLNDRSTAALGLDGFFGRIILTR